MNSILAISDEDALQMMETAGYDDYDMQYYRSLRFWLELSPYETLCYLIQERGFEESEEQDATD